MSVSRKGFGCCVKFQVISNAVAISEHRRVGLGYAIALISITVYLRIT